MSTVQKPTDRKMEQRMNVQDIRTDLIAEQDALDAIVANLRTDEWATTTASPRWTVADQIGHLAYFDATATVAINDPDRFRELVAELMPAFTSDDDDVGDKVTLGDFRAMSPEQLLEAWRSNRTELADAAAALGDDERVTWYGPSMSSKSFLTARLMEVWAHGQDIADALRAERASTDRIRHIAQLGFITHKWSFQNRKLDPPSVAIRVELNAPSGDIWYFGPEEATNRILGPAEDFCLVVTQRRHVDDTELNVTGKGARSWMHVAQAFAGPPTDGPPAGSF